MSGIVVTCPQCGTSLQNTPDIAGQLVCCPSCQIQLQMPAANAGLTPPPQPAVPELPAQVQQPAPTNVSVTSPGSSSRPHSSVQDRIRRRSNPTVMIVTLLIVLLLGVIGTVAFLWDRAESNRDRMRKQLIGNWELADGQTQFKRWEFAFHADGGLDMVLENDEAAELSKGRWKVTRARGNAAHVLIEWPDDAPETMIVRLAGGQMEVELPSVGKFTFREAMAVPIGP